MVLSSSILHPFVGLQRLPLSSVGCGCPYASVVVSKGAALLKLGRSLDWLICNGFLVKLPEPHNIQILYKCDTDQVKAFPKNRMSVALKKKTLGSSALEAFTSYDIADCSETSGAISRRGVTKWAPVSSCKWGEVGTRISGL